MSSIAESEAQYQAQPKAVSRREQRELFREGLPDNPYCMTRREGRPSGRMLIRPLYVASRFPYIQVNPPWLTVALLFDIDRPGAAGAWCAADLPEPVATVTNRDNGHAHTIYVLNAPVLTGYNARRKPQNLMAAIYGAMTERMNADTDYSGLIAKNPLAGRAWQVLWSRHPARYELKFLAEFLTDRELKKHFPCKANRVHLVSIGRNVDTFNAVREWSYRAVKRYWRANANEWHDAVLYQVQDVNACYTNPMAENECRAIAKSIANWTWRRLSPAGFSAVQQARRARRTAKTREANAERDAAIIEARLRGETLSVIAAAHGLTKGRVSQIANAAGLA